MAGRPPRARDGELVKNEPSGFPLFYDARKQRVVTADPWAFISHLAVTKLKKNQEVIAIAYVQQAREFFEGAQNPRLHSRPLLYYYAFLNVVKAALLIRGVKLPATAKHGINDPRANSRQRLRFEGQQIHIHRRAADHSEIFPEFLAMLGYSGNSPRSWLLLDLLKLVPNIHRTYTKVEGCDPIFLPVRRFEVLHARSEAWARVCLNREDKDVSDVLSQLRGRRKFKGLLRHVSSEINTEIWFETEAVPARRRGLDNGIGVLARRFRDLGVAPILTLQGYRFYLINASPGELLPYLGAAFAAIFYLGSITRYKPDVFEKIVSGKHSWIIEEFLSTQPAQFLYSLASELAGVDVVRPYATIS